ncbi:unnamed protein product [Rotaria sp. Silwood1]|nr:unnamed protein product [Rotaria sp. Silwood1]
MLTRENIITSFDHKQDPTSVDKLHRRNPYTVRQEIQSFDDVILETTLDDVQLNEMPGLQDTEQWKRIATRSFQAPSPLSHKYDQTKTSIVELQNEKTQEILESSHRTQSTKTEDDKSNIDLSLWCTPRRRILFILSMVIIMVVIIVVVVVTVILVRKPSPIITDYYSGCIIVQAHFDPVLLSLSSSLAVNYQREFCSLITKAFVDPKTKYAVFHSTCRITNFRNGSIIGDFILGFTRYQNVTRLNTYLNRTLVHKQLFGGSILKIVFNSTINDDTNNHLTSISTLSSKQSKRIDERQKRMQDYVLQDKLVSSKQDYHTDHPSYNDKSSSYLATISYRWNSLNNLSKIYHSSSTETYKLKFTDRKKSLTSNKNLTI